MWDLKCIAAALCFLTSNVLFIVHGVLTMNANFHAKEVMAETNNNAASGVEEVDDEEDFNYEYWKLLDPTYVRYMWAIRESQRPIVISASVLGALAWFWMIAPVVQSAWILSKGFKRDVGPHMLLAAMAISGGMIELLSRLLVAGMTNASLWLSKDFNMNDWDEGDVMGTGWRVLEMIHIVTAGMLLWIDAFESLAIFGIIGIIFYSIETEPRFVEMKKKRRRAASSSSPIIIVENDEDGSSSSTTNDAAAAASGTISRVPVEPTFSQCFANYGLFVGLLALLDFVADVLRFVDWGIFGRMSLAMNLVLGVIFLPMWLLCLAKELPSATERYEREEGRVLRSLFLANYYSVVADDDDDESRAALVVGNDEGGSALAPPPPTPTPPPDHMTWPTRTRSSEDEGGIIS